MYQGRQCQSSWPDWRPDPSANGWGANMRTRLGFVCLFVFIFVLCCLFYGIPKEIWIATGKSKCQIGTTSWPDPSRTQMIFLFLYSGNADALLSYQVDVPSKLVCAMHQACAAEPVFLPICLCLWQKLHVHRGCRAAHWKVTVEGMLYQVLKKHLVIECKVLLEMS